MVHGEGRQDLKWQRECAFSIPSIKRCVGSSLVTLLHGGQTPRTHVVPCPSKRSILRGFNTHLHGGLLVNVALHIQCGAHFSIDLDGQLDHVLGAQHRQRRG